MLILSHVDSRPKTQNEWQECELELIGYVNQGAVKGAGEGGMNMIEVFHWHVWKQNNDTC
jgi:hypothetical protein